MLHDYSDLESWFSLLGMLRNSSFFLRYLKNGGSLGNQGRPIIDLFGQSQERATSYITYLLAYFVMLGKKSLIETYLTQQRPSKQNGRMQAPREREKKEGEKNEGDESRTESLDLLHL